MTRLLAAFLVWFVNSPHAELPRRAIEGRRARMIAREFLDSISE